MKNTNDSLEINLKQLVSLLPDAPGIYQFLDKSGVIIYIGKAKNLKKRVSSYFSKIHDSGKTRVLVRKIEDIHHLVVDSEEDALFLENNLIKKYQPRYNVLLKDDKTFPWIVIPNEPFPRIIHTRTVIKDGSTYFGPYTSGLVVKTLLELFRKLYPIRTCSLALSETNIKAGKFKVCLEYHLGNCKGPCIGEYSNELYFSHIKEIKNILKGNIALVVKYMKHNMTDLANSYEFEKAEVVRLKIAVLESFQSKSTIVNPKLHDVDVFSIDEDEISAYVNFLKVSNGAIIQAYTVEYRKRMEVLLPELLSLAIVEIRERVNSLSREIIVPFLPDVELSGIEFTIPKIGDKKSLLELSERNVKFFKLEKMKQRSIVKKEPNEVRVLKTLQKDLNLSKLPIHIECFDNSNIQGNFSVAACVVFKNAKPSKKDYRHFNIKTVEGPDDFASMEEVVFRRYKRFIDEALDLPNLIIIDGGKGQLGAALNSLRLLGISIPIIGIAKRLEEIFFPGDPVPLYLDKNSESLKLIQQLRNEAHRFGITFHRNLRSNQFIKSELDSIKGIGENTIKKLLTQFKSIKEINLLTFNELEAVVGKSRAQIVFDYFHPNK